MSTRANPLHQQPSGRAGADDWRALLRAGLARLQARDAGGAAPFLRRAARLAPDEGPVRMALAAACLRQGAAAEALAEFEAARRIAPSCAAPCHGEGLARHALGDRAGALDAFRRAVTADPFAFRSWGSIADIASDEAERINAIGGAADALVVLCTSEGRHEALWKACVRALLDARRPAAAIRFLRAHAASVNAAGPGHQHLAHALYEQGAFRPAFLEAKRAFDPDPARSEAAVPAFSPDAAVLALTAITAILDAAGIGSFLAAGTLLGFWREGAPLRHDRDVDIGVLSDSGGGPDIAGALRAHPDILMPRRARPGDRYFPVVFRDVGIDIFLHHPEGGALVCGLGNRPGDIAWRFSRFALTECRFGGRRWRVPDAPERYLSECYGPGWQNPNRHFASVLSSPSLSGVDEHVRGCYAIWRAGKALRAADRTKAAALLCQAPLTAPLAARLHAKDSDVRPHYMPDDEDNPPPDEAPPRH